MTQILTRHRFEIKRRLLTVTGKTFLTPQMIRLTLSGEELADFQSLAPDDHVKLFFETGAENPEARDYTPRSFDPATKTLTLDFAVHEAGPATRWAVEAEPGAKLTVAGPRGSAVVALEGFDWLLLIGDETALPAMGRWIEELPAGARALSLGFVTGSEEEQEFAAQAEHRAIWAHRSASAAADPAPALEAAAKLELPEGRGFVWIAAEAGVARALRAHFMNERGQPREWIKAAGYWVQGQADASDKTMDAAD